MALSLLNGGKQLTVRDDELEGVQNGDPETTYTLRQIEQSRLREVRRRHTKPVFTRQGREDKVDTDAVMDDILDEVLIAWTGVLDNGEPAQLTRENKLLLDFGRKVALIGLAGSNEVQKQAEKEQSFRRPAGVVSGLGR